MLDMLFSFVPCLFEYSVHAFSRTGHLSLDLEDTGQARQIKIQDLPARLSGVLIRGVRDMDPRFHLIGTNCVISLLIGSLRLDDGSR